MLEKEKIVTITSEIAPYAPEEQLGDYHLRRWTWYESQGAKEKASTIIDAKKGLIRMSVNDLYLHVMLTTIRDPPKTLEGKWNADYIRDQLDEDVGNILRDACRDINGMTEREQRGFLRPSELEKDTPG